MVRVRDFLLGVPGLWLFDPDAAPSPPSRPSLSFTKPDFFSHKKPEKKKEKKKSKLLKPTAECERVIVSSRLIACGATVAT